MGQRYRNAKISYRERMEGTESQIEHQVILNQANKIISKGYFREIQNQ